jgi:hypothetical protein
MNSRTRGVQADGKINLTAGKASGKFIKKSGQSAFESSANNCEAAAERSRFA